MVFFNQQFARGIVILSNKKHTGSNWVWSNAIYDVRLDWYISWGDWRMLLKIFSIPLSLPHFKWKYFSGHLILSYPQSAFLFERGWKCYSFRYVRFFERTAEDKIFWSERYKTPPHLWLQTQSTVYILIFWAFDTMAMKCDALRQYGAKNSKP